MQQYIGSRVESDLEQRDFMDAVLRRAYRRMSDNQILALFMYTFGHSNTKIARALEMTQQGVSHDLARAYELIRRAAIVERNAVRGGK